MMTLLKHLLLILAVSMVTACGTASRTLPETSISPENCGAIISCVELD